MQENPLWPVTKRFPKLYRDLTVDVAIIGGGIAGISCGYFLHEAGYEVAILERDEVGSGASGASSGILFYGTGIGFLKAVELYGRESATMLWAESNETIIRMLDLITEKNLNCGLRQPGALMVAETEGEIQEIVGEHTALKSAGLQAEIIDSQELKKFFTPREFRAALAFEICAQIHPAIFAAELARETGLPVYESSGMESFTEESSGVVVKTPGGTVSSESIIIATNLQPCFGLEKFFRVESSTIVVSQALPDAELRRIWPDKKILWTTEELYDIIYPREKRNVLEVYRVKEIKPKLGKYFPNGAFTVETQWGDSWSKTDDWLPIIGKIRPRVYVAVAMGDQGVVTGFTAGRKAPMLLSDKTDPFLRMVSPNRFGSEP